MWILQSLTDETPRPLTFRLPPGTVRTIGRAKRADFIVDAAMVSRLHCRLTASLDGPLVVEDLGSTNGTFVNDLRVKNSPLVPGDRLRVGRVEMVVSEASQADQ